MSLSSLDASFLRAERDYLTPPEEPECVCDTRGCDAKHPDEDTAPDDGWTIIHTDEVDIVECPKCTAKTHAEALKPVPGEFEDAIPCGVECEPYEPEQLPDCFACGTPFALKSGLCVRCEGARSNALEALALGQMRAGFQHSSLRYDHTADVWVARLESRDGRETVERVLVMVGERAGVRS